MQTFLPYESFAESAQVLDRQRLGKQRIETRQILETLLGKSTAWKNHPAVKMWRGYERTLAYYGVTVCEEWRSRGYADSQQQLFLNYLKDLPYNDYPEWLGNKEFHESHQSNLVRKLPSHYRQYFPTIPDDLPYIWPKEKI